jgi:peptidoglycan/xylan/chitin deacetylase (PgdA/CDA1 family)
MLKFARTHSGFVPAGTFYVNRDPFGSAVAARRALRWLTRNGFEIGNHTRDHVPLATLSDEEVQEQLATGAELIQRILPGYRIRTLALPLGSPPATAHLAVRGSWNGQSYGPYGVLLVGAGPAPSPYSKAFDPAAIPRIRTSQAGWKGEPDFAFSYWMRELERNPRTRYVSDGDPGTVAISPGSAKDVATRFAARVQEDPEGS